MAFSSRRGGGWAHSVLPTSTKPRLKRRRYALKDFLLSNFFTISLLLSLFLFISLLLFTVVPKPHFRHRHRRHTPSGTNRKPPSLVDNQNVSGSRVDITTKGLYDRIQFDDVDGGTWKQGWRVSYRGNEWDSEKLKIFVVPHSHNDPGWRLTVEEYYDRQSRHILDTIVDTLSKDVRRKFIWEEISYLERWWRDATERRKQSFIRLVKSGQLEIVGGGWVMNDEANSHYYAIIEQIMEGNLWLNDTVGQVPKNSWAIDTFGYSSTMAYLLRRMGFENMLIQRTHYELKKELALNKNLEYIWRQSWDTEETTDIFVHMMPFYSYDVPHTCGPEPAICCQFDFARMRGFVYELCPWGEHPIETTHENVKKRALLLLDQYKKKSSLYRTNTLLIPLGDDFRYISIDEAEAQFRNYQLIFDHINSDPSLNTEAKFGTLDDYFTTLREEADRVNYSRPGEVGSDDVEGFPSLSGDFFTYADRKQDYWSGYYVSRPFFKAVDRVLEHTLRASEIMIALLLGSCSRSSCEKLPLGFAYKLTAARRNLALFQHHDGVTGTAKDHVVEDYGIRMYTSLQDLQIFMSKAIEVFIGMRHERSDHLTAQLEPSQVRSKYDAQPVHKVINALDKTAYSVILFNPSEQIRDEVVMVVTDRYDMTVLDSNWTCVKSQVSPEFHHDKNKIFSGRHRLFWKATIPPLGLQVYYIANRFVGCEKTKLAKLKIFTNGKKKLQCPSPYICSKLESETVVIRNKYQSLTFDTNLGILRKINHDDGSENIIGEEIAMYASSDSGAYLFKPNGEAEQIIQTGGELVVSEGFLMHEVYSNPETKWDKNPISHSTRIYNGDDTIQQFIIEKDYHVELNHTNFNDRELVVRYKTDLDNKRVFYSDLNGFQMSRREFYEKIPIQGNYYPMPSLAYIQGVYGERFSVHTRQSLGVAGPRNGCLEIMLDRRLLRDDGHGLGQGVTDNRPMNVIFHILIESNISATSDPVSNPTPLSPSLLSHRIGAHLNYPLHMYISKKSEDISVQPPPRSFAPMTSSLPCDLHIVNFKVPRPTKYSQQPRENPRFVLILQRWHWANSYSHKGGAQCSSVADEPINLFDMFKNVTVSNARPTSLNLVHDDMEILGYTEQGDVSQEGHVLISPMEIQAYKMDLRPHEEEA